MSRSTVIYMGEKVGKTSKIEKSRKFDFLKKKFFWSGPKTFLEQQKCIKEAIWRGYGPLTDHLLWGVLEKLPILDKNPDLDQNWDQCAKNAQWGVLSASFGDSLRLLPSRFALLLLVTFWVLKINLSFMKVLWIISVHYFYLSVIIFPLLDPKY